MDKESTQHKLDRVRKPRVHITYDVEIGDAMEMKELPFVMGVISDLSGNPEESLPDLKKRGFVEVDRDNFNEFLKKQNPRVSFKVDDKITGDPDKQMAVDITFDKMKDFEPEGVVDKVPVLKELLEVRQRLRSLHSRVTSSDEVSDFLKDILESEERRNEVADVLGISGDGEGGGGEESGGGDDAAGGDEAPEGDKEE